MTKVCFVAIYQFPWALKNCNFLINVRAILVAISHYQVWLSIAVFCFVLFFGFLFFFLFLFQIVRQPEHFALLACQLYMLLCFSALSPFVSSLFTLTLCRLKASEGIKFQLFRGTYSAKTSHSKEERRSRKAIHLLNGNHIFLSFLEPLSHNL